MVQALADGKKPKAKPADKSESMEFGNGTEPIPEGNETASWPASAAISDVSVSTNVRSQPRCRK
jgi:hypothetical protein